MTSADGCSRGNNESRSIERVLGVVLITSYKADKNLTFGLTIVAILSLEKTGGAKLGVCIK